MARNSTEEPNRLIAASVGLAIPSDREHAYGYLSEHHRYGETERKCGDHAEDIAASMLGNTLGIEVDPDKAWDDRKQEFKTHDRIFKTTAITQSAIGDKEGHWTSVIAAAVFVDETDEGETEVINNKFEIVQNVQEKLDFPENSNENAEHVKENNAPKTEEPKAKEKTS